MFQQAEWSWLGDEKQKGEGKIKETGKRGGHQGGRAWRSTNSSLNCPGGGTKRGDEGEEGVAGGRRGGGGFGATCARRGDRQISKVPSLFSERVWEVLGRSSRGGKRSPRKKGGITLGRRGRARKNGSFRVRRRRPRV